MGVFIEDEEAVRCEKGRRGMEGRFKNGCGRQ